METNKTMSLEDFLAHFDFGYDIVSPGGKYETKIRQERIEDGDLSEEDANSDLICLIDFQGAYFGDINKERYPIHSDSVAKIIDRMGVYIQDSIIEEFETALQSREIDTDNLDLEDMISKCKELDVGVGEVCYRMAEAVCHPESIILKEARRPERLPLDAQIQSAENKMVTPSGQPNAKVQER